MKYSHIFSSRINKKCVSIKRTIFWEIPKKIYSDERCNKVWYNDVFQFNVNNTFTKIYNGLSSAGYKILIEKNIYWSIFTKIMNEIFFLIFAKLHYIHSTKALLELRAPNSLHN